jgi:hypothetical protein
MGSNEGERIPDWAVREREQDLAWIGENTHVLLPAAKLSHEESGRGAIIIDTNTLVERGEQAGNPMFYLPAQQIEQNAWGAAIKMVREYDPSQEFVAVLLKKNRESAYRIGVPAAKKINGVENSS